jgi:serine/threonine protein kinase
MKKVGNYLLLSELGKGQFGVVYKAQNTKNEEIYAMKSITKQSVNSSPQLKALFDTEVKIMSNIRHPNIMHLYELLETTNNYYLVLDYCCSGDLENYVKKHEGLGEAEAVYLLMQIMNGFKELHKHKIMHRDFKLANIFMNEDRCVIGDFGFAKSGADMTLTYLGSPITMAPEILLQKGKNVPYTNKADLWSIGVCFYEMIFGVEPWPKITSVEQLKQQVALYNGQTLRFPQKTNFRISEECRNLLISLIEADPNRRISWDAFYKHPLFVMHQQQRAGDEMKKSIMFRNNQDQVAQLFERNRNDKNTGEFELNTDPNKIDGFVIVPNQQTMIAPAEAEKNKQRILDRYTHEKRIMVNMIQQSVKLRNLSKEKTFLAAAEKGLMLCGILLLKKTTLLNFFALESLETGRNIYGMKDFEIFLNTQDKIRLVNELKITDIPTYRKLFDHLLLKLKQELGLTDPVIIEVIQVVENPNPQIFERVEQLLKRHTKALISFFQASQLNFPQNLKIDMVLVLAQLYTCSKHLQLLPFIKDGIPFDWHLFDKSWEGHPGIQKANELLNQAILEP